MFLECNDNTVLCGASAYEKKFYLNDAFFKLPDWIKNELKVMCVLFSEEMGGIIMLVYDDSGRLCIQIRHKEDDFCFDEIGSDLKVKQIRNEKKELFESLELYYRTFFC